MKLYAEDADSDEAEDDLLFLLGERGADEFTDDVEEDYFVVEVKDGDPIALRNWMRKTVERIEISHFQAGRSVGRQDLLMPLIIACIMLVGLLARGCSM
jgi:hypothetical protein